ncbi:MAG: transcriptional regulator [Archaeoglobaceae archaeon]
MVKYILPAIRAMVAKELIERGYKIKEVAEMLGLTQAAVSQYLTSKRGKKGLEFLEKNEEVRKIVVEIADAISKRKKGFENEEYLCRICESIREQKY